MATTDNNEIPQKYNVIEYAEGAPSHVGKFHKVTNLPDSNGKKDCYYSVYRHSEEIIHYYKTHKNDKGNPTLEGYHDSVWLDEFVLDIDMEGNLEAALQKLRTFIEHLESRYELDGRHLRINFSGFKGFHIRFPSVLFDGFDPSPNLPEKIKEIFNELTDGDKDFDGTIYHHVAFIRVVNSRNSKSGLCAIPLSASEVFSLSIDEIKEFAENPRTVEYIPIEELVPNQEFVKLKDQHLGKPFTKEKKSGDVKAEDELWQGVGEGKRNAFRAKLVGRMLVEKSSNDLIIKTALLWNKQCTPPESEKTVISHVEKLIRDFGHVYGKFWTIDKKRKVEISLTQYMDFLSEEGFGKIYFGSNYLFIRIRDNRIKEYSLPQIKDYVMDYISRLPDTIKNLIREEILRRASYYLGEKLIECIPTIDPFMITDKKEESYFFFTNSVVVVNIEEGITFTEYKDNVGLVWESQIIDKDFRLLDRSDQTNLCEFEKFLLNVGRGDYNRFRAISSAIGYLLHGFKDSSNSKVIVLCDERISDYPDGRTGKSLFGKGLSKIKKAARIDGKNFSFDSRFTFQQVQIDTKILEFNDVPREFDFEKLFSVITDDMTVENKGMKPFVIPFDMSPKILVSTNYTIEGNGSSFTDRMYELEFSDHYNDKHKPLDEFNHRFFDEWDNEEWNRFNNFMLDCVYLYLREGLISQAPINLIKKKAINDTNKDFVEYMQTLAMPGEHDKNVIFSDFKTTYTDYYDLARITFSKWVRKYCKTLDISFEARRSNGKDYLIFN